MQMKWIKKPSPRNSVKKRLGCMALIVAAALSVSGCGEKEGDTSPEAVVSGESGYSDGSQLGEGSTKFELLVSDRDGKETRLEIHTDRETVGEALMELGVIAGEDSEYGLFVKTVNGISYDYDKDGVYWAFYVDGEYALTGVDATPVTAETDYAFKAE